MSQCKPKSPRAKRKGPNTVHSIRGMLYSSACLDQDAIEKKEISYSFGITQSAQILAGQAAELALKWAFEAENPDKIAASTHRLDCLFNSLSSDRKQNIEDDYASRIRQYRSLPIEGWRTAKQVFLSGGDYPVLFRYLTEGPPSFEVQPQYLREAVCSVLVSLGFKTEWAQRSPKSLD